MIENTPSFLDKLQDFAAAGLLSIFGGSAAYVYKTVKEDTGFKFGQFFVNIFLAFFIGNLIGSFIPENMANRDGILMMSGFSTWPILAVVELYGKRFAVKLFGDKLELPK